MFRRLLSGLGKLDKPSDLAGLQDAGVRHVAVDMADLQGGEWSGREWVYLAVNHEVQAEDGLRSSTQASVLARHEGANLEKQLLASRPRPMSAQGQDSGDADIARVNATPGAMMEAWIMTFANYGQAMTGAGFARYGVIAAASTVPVIAPGKEKFTLADMPKIEAQASPRPCSASSSPTTR